MISRRAFFTSLLFFMFGLLASAWILPRQFGLPYPKPLGVEFDALVKRQPLEEVKAGKPQLALLGDSALYFGVDNEALSKEMGISTYSLGIPGAASALWYLSLKNILLEAPAPPHTVVILFRDTMLTLPEFRTTGWYFEQLDDYARRREPLLNELAFIQPMSSLGRMAEAYLPLYGARWELRQNLDTSVRYSPAAWLGCPATCVDDALSGIFGKQGVDVVALNRAIADSQGSLYAPKALDFQRQVKRSFLPHMIALAQERGVHLIFIRAKTLTYPQPAFEPPALRAYIRDLNSYLTKQSGVTFVDMAHDERIQAQYFSDELHFNEEGKAQFTRLLAGELTRLLQDANGKMNP